MANPAHNIPPVQLVILKKSDLEHDSVPLLNQQNTAIVNRLNQLANLTVAPTTPTDGQVLTYDATTGQYTPATPAATEGVPSGGTTGQVLTKTASGTSWADDDLASLVSTPFASVMGNFTVPHNLGYTPRFATIRMTSLGNVAFTTVAWDQNNFYLQGAAASLTGYVDSIR